MEKYDVTCLFYNPCIEPESEYTKRLEAFKHVCEKLGVKYIVGDYDNREFRKLTAGHEQQPEGGSRCIICYKQRLQKSAEYAATHGFDAFTTTLTISPHKNSKIIFDIGSSVKGSVEFIELDFKKNDGFKHSVDMSKEFGIYRQNYCGCEFSRNKSIASPNE
jgi:predicted adenine nucleotide alpha hydrolase (AANH) superfamily ATPase